MENLPTESKAWEWREVDPGEGLKLARQRKNEFTKRADLTDEERNELEYIDQFLNPRDHKEEWE